MTENVPNRSTESSETVRGANGNLAVQLALPQAAAMGWLGKSVGELIRQAGFANYGRDDGRKKCGRWWANATSSRPNEGHAVGRKMILGIRQGATENATVVGGFLGHVMNRGFDFSEARL